MKRSISRWLRSGKILRRGGYSGGGGGEIGQVNGSKKVKWKYVIT